MPLGPAPGGGTRVFFEETSLVARPAVSFAECARRAARRLQHLGVRVREGSVEDEEFCYIPMGGALPAPGQRVVAFGGAGSLVHPATGYQLCRALAAAGDVAAALAAELGDGAAAPCDPDRAAAAAYSALWPAPRQLQREFATFGGEFLMAADVELLRGWCGAGLLFRARSRDGLPRGSS